MKNKLPVVYVEWIDHSSAAGWNEWDSELAPIKCTTIGFLLKETDDFIVVSHTVVKEDELSPDPFCIIKSTMTKLKYKGYL